MWPSRKCSEDSYERPLQPQKSVLPVKLTRGADAPLPKPHSLYMVHQEASERVRQAPLLQHGRHSCS